MNDQLSDLLRKNKEQLKNRFPKEAQIVSLEADKDLNICCPWHKSTITGHKGNFGLMNECIDCMKEIKNGRCTLDVKNFSFDTYWNVKRFWDKVDIKNQDECWPWLGSTKKNNSETNAYFISPFHSGKTQSAARVAFWVTRGYTGRLRIFHQEGCDILCCNPLHLKIRELESIPKPKTISAINLQYGNIFDSAHENQLKNLSSLT